MDVEEAGGVGLDNSGEVGSGYTSRWERLGDEDAGVVDQRVDAPETGHTFGNRPHCRVPGHQMSPGMARTSGLFDGLTDRAVRLITR